VSVSVAVVRRLALELPESAEAPHHEMTSFRVAGKIFATLPPDGERLHLFLPEDEVAAYRAEFPDAVEELWWGQRLRGCRVALRQADRALAREMLTESWRHKAPRKLLEIFEG
jgi:hypothetical protein